MAGPAAPFDPRQFLTLAKALAQTPTDETKLRCAVGRAYYAVFLVGRRVCRVTAESDVHNAVIFRVKSKQSGTGGKLTRLFKLRKLADYTLLPDPADDNWLQNWQAAEKMADELIPILEGWEIDPNFVAWFNTRFPP